LSNQLGLRVGNHHDQVLFHQLLHSCWSRIKVDLREELNPEPSLLPPNQEHIASRLANYLDYKNQFKGLKNNKTLNNNLSTLYSGLTAGCPLLVFNCCEVPGVGDFLKIAVEVLDIDMVEISSPERLKLAFELETIFNRKVNRVRIYLLPCWVLSDR
jgi:hypothetical protein